MLEIQLNVPSLKRLDDNREWRGYFCAVPIGQLPDALNEWIKGVNPRSFRNSQTAKDIQNTLLDQPERFLLRNKGMLITAEDVQYDQKTSVATLRLSDPKIHGIADGGTTFRVIKQFGDTEGPAMVRIEILTGITDREMLSDVVEARNDNVRIREVSVMNHEGDFKGIEKALEDQDYASRIAYEENADGDISVVDIVGTLLASTEVYEQGNHPVVAYSTASKALREYKSHKDEYDKHLARLASYLKFHDDVYEWITSLFKHKYAETLEDLGVKRLESPIDLPFNGRQTSYAVPRGYVLPVVAAFRSQKNREQTFEVVQERLGKELWMLINDAGSPNKFGKSRANWTALYGIVQGA